ncbi:MAG: hypothetical protein Kow00105_16030 [Phycisphaeraceae bacterium]
MRSIETDAFVRANVVFSPLVEARRKHEALIVFVSADKFTPAWPAVAEYPLDRRTGIRGLP